MVAKRSRDYNLERRGDTWYVVLTVPPLVQEAMGRKRLRKTTGTTDILKARLKRDTILGEMRREIADAKRGFKLTGPMQEALEWRREIEEQDDDGMRVGLELALHEKAEEIEKVKGLAAAKAFYGLASGQATPIGLHHEAFLTEKKYKARQLMDYRNQVKRLEGWMISAGLSPSLEAITDKVASRYKTETLVKPGVHPKTANKWLSSLQSYWKWMAASGHVEINPWIGKSLPRVRTPYDDREREFTDAEMVALLKGDADGELRAAMMIAALSGMRIEEIFRLKVKHCKDGCFAVAHDYVGKTKAAERVVPIHSELQALIAGLCERRSEGEFILKGSPGRIRR